MKILWIVNMVFPEVAAVTGVTTGVSGGWMFDLAKRISETDGIELNIASVYSGSELKEIKIGKITYFLIPGGGHKMLIYSKSLIPYWETIRDKVIPDIVHLHGTEYSHGLVYMNTFPNDKYILTIQGILESISRELNAGVPTKELFNMTFNEFLHFNGMIHMKYLFRKNKGYEAEIIKHVKYATGRTDWDKAMMLSMNPNLEYFRCNYNLREEFYDASKWDIKKAEPYLIYGSTSAQSALKGGHILIKALAIVKRKYPEVKARFLMPGSKNGEFNINSGFKKYEKKLIDKYDLWDNIEFVPSQDAFGVIENMNQCRCIVVPSAMENASSTLREAMHLGVPAIAAFRGGMTELISDKNDGFLFDFPEYKFLAQRIIDLLGSEELCNRFSERAKEKAEIWHDRKKNTADMIDVYNYIYEREN